MVRDIALAASGLLNPKLGGPQVYPPAPEFLFQPPASYGPKPGLRRPGDGPLSAALYTFRCRSVPYPVLPTSTRPMATLRCVRRPRSNTPLQALTTLNETLFVELPRAWPCAPGRTGLGRRGADQLRLPPLPGRTPTETERAVLLGSAGQAITTDRSAADANPWDLAATIRHRRLPPRSHAAQAGRLDGRGARAAEPRRDHHQGMTMRHADDSITVQVHLQSATSSVAKQFSGSTRCADRNGPCVARCWSLRAVWRRPGLPSASAIAGLAQLGRAAV